MGNSIRNFDPYTPVYARDELISKMSVDSTNHDNRGGEEEKNRVIFSFSSSLNPNVKLHTSLNPWKPLHLCEKPPDEKDKLKRSVLGVLNKLTPQKFETLLSQLKCLNIDTEEKLALLVDLIFEKAVNEPMFSVAYANLCKHLSMIKVPVSGTSGKQINLRKLLLTKCQKEFEQDKGNQLKIEEKMKALEVADPDQKKELLLEYEEEEKKIRCRQLGNIRFIGELFKLGMLIEPIIHECIKKLLSEGDEESLECVSLLLITTGKELEHDFSRVPGKIIETSKHNQMDIYYAQIKLIIDERRTSSRVRFKLQDVMDLKNNNWVPRRDGNEPKLIDQIRKKAKSEELQQVYQSRRDYLKRITDRDYPKKANWNRSSKSNKGIYSMVDPSKLKLSKPNEVDYIRLGPGGRGLQSWGRSNSGGSKTAADSDKTARTNSGKPASTSKEKNLKEAVEQLTSKSEAKVSEVNANADVHVNMKTSGTEELTLNGPEYSKDFIERKTKYIIGEFLLENNGLEETVKYVVDLVSPNTVHIFINTAIKEVLEGYSQARYSVGQLLSSLLKKKTVSSNQYKEGFAGVLESIDDQALDVPLIWDRIGEILAPIIEDTETPFQLLKEILQPCIPSKKAGLLVSSTIKCAVRWKLGKIWKESGVQWTDIIGIDGNVAEFIKKHQLEFTVSPTKAARLKQLPMEKMKASLLNLLEKNSAIEDAYDWIDANISDTSDPTFIRALVTAVHESCLSGSGTTWELNISKLKSRMPLISRYVSTNKKLQLQAFYATQEFMHQLD